MRSTEALRAATWKAFRGAVYPSEDSMRGLAHDCIGTVAIV